LKKPTKKAYQNQQWHAQFSNPRSTHNMEALQKFVNATPEQQEKILEKVEELQGAEA